MQIWFLFHCFKKYFPLLSTSLERDSRGGAIPEHETSKSAEKEGTRRMMILFSVDRSRELRLFSLFPLPRFAAMQCRAM